MKHLPLSALFVLALTPLPALAAPAPAPAANEMELHIEARGSVSADYAIVKRKLAAVKRGRPAAEAALTAQIAEKKAQLLKLGIPAAAVTVAEPSFREGVEEGEFPGAMYARVAMEKPVGVADPDEEDEPVIEAADGAEAAMEAAKAAGAAATSAAKKVAKKRKLP
jgi:hypothetical protein